VRKNFGGWQDRVQRTIRNGIVEPYDEACLSWHFFAFVFSTNFVTFKSNFRNCERKLMLAFYDSDTNKLIGTVKLVDGRCVIDAKTELDYDFLEGLSGHTEHGIRMFFEQFTDYSSITMYTAEFADDEVAPDPAPLSEEPPEVWTAEEIKKKWR